MIVRTIAKEDDLARVAQDMRVVDAAEVRVSSGWGPTEALLWAWGRSLETVAFWSEGQLCGVAGVAPMFDPVGDGGWLSPWMLSTPLVDTYQPGLGDAMRVFFFGAAKARGAAGLANFVWHEQVWGLSWLRRSGFEVGEAIPYGVAGEAFHPFHWSNGVCASRSSSLPE